MTKKDFLNLLELYEKGNCSGPERELLFRHCDAVQEQEIMNSWDLSEKEVSRIRMLKNINHTINRIQRTKRKKRNSLIWRTAIVFIGIVSASYFYLQNTNAKTSQPSNVITLQLEDGTIQVIEEDGTAKVTDRESRILGQQKGNTLIYKANSDVQNLVYNTLQVPYGKRFEIVLSDGSLVHLNAGSSFKYPVKFLNGEDRKVFITGEAYFKVTPDSEHPFIVNTNNVDVKVLGTEFNVQAYPEDNVAEIVLVEGSVSLISKAENIDYSKQTILSPNQKAVFNFKSKELNVDLVLTDVYTSWRKGELVFRNVTFENLLKKVERHYDMKIINENKSLSNKKFNASFGNEPFENVLQEFKEIYGIEYIIKDGEIRVQ